MANNALDEIEKLRQAALEEQAGPADVVPPQPAQSLDPVNPTGAQPFQLPPAVEQKSPYGAGMTDADLKGAFDYQRHRNNLAAIINAGAALAKAVGGSTPLNAGDAFSKDADSMVKEVQARRAGVDQDFKATQQREAAAPDSKDARFRQYLMQQMPETRELAGQMGSKLADVPADQMPSMLDLLKEHAATLRAQKAGSAAGTAASSATWGPIIESMAPSMGWTPEQVAGFKQSIASGLSERSANKLFGGTPGAVYGAGQAKDRAQIAADAARNRQERNLDFRGDQADQNRVTHIADKIDNSAASVKQSLAELRAQIPQLEAQFGDLPGTGLIQDYLSRHRGGSEFLLTKEGKDLQNKVRNIELLARQDITGKVFSKQEAEQIRAAMANLMSGDSLKRSLDNVETLVDAGLDKTYAGNPHAADAYLRNAPWMSTKRFRSGANSSASATGAPPLPTGTPVREPGGAEAPVRVEVPPGTKEVSFKLANGKIAHVPAEKVADFLALPLAKGATQVSGK